MAKKQQESFGQLSIWDIKITEEATQITKTEDLFTEKAVSDTKIEVSDTEFIKNITLLKFEKPVNPLELTEEQQDFLNKNKFMENENLSRVIKYCGGGLGIELMYEDSFETIYVNTKGEKEFSIPKKSPILPTDRVVYYKTPIFKPNNIQEKKLRNIKDKAVKIIRRKGDENIIVELEDKVISINALGWMLEFENVQAIYTDDEIENIAAEPLENLFEIQRRVKVGDFVEASFGDKVITGKICHVYGPDNVTLNIIFDNGKKHTAIYRGCVKRLIQSA